MKDKENQMNKGVKILGLLAIAFFILTYISPVYKFSGGEQQRVALARIVLQESQLILADEPTGSLDCDNRDLVVDTLRSMQKENKTVLIVTHDPAVADKCDRVIEL